MAFLKKITQLKNKIQRFENLVDELGGSSAHQQHALELAEVKALLQQYLLKQKLLANAPTSNKWKVEWWTDTPIEVKKDTTVKVRVQVGGFKFSESDKNTPISIAFAVTFGSTTETVTLTQVTQSNEWWFAYRGDITIPNDFLSGDFQVNVTATIGTKKYKLSGQGTIEGIVAEGQEVLDYLNSMDLSTDPLSTYKTFLETDIKDKSLRMLNAFKLQLEDAIEDVQTNMFQPAQRLSSPAKVLLEQLIKDSPINCKASFRRHYNSEIADGTTAYYNTIHFSVYLPNKKITDFTTSYIQPLQEKVNKIQTAIQDIETQNLTIELNYENNLQEIRQKTAEGGQIVALIKNICDLTPRLDILKENNNFLNDEDGTDAFRLVVKDRGLVETIFQELTQIKTEHIRLSNEIVKIYNKSLYKSNGSFKDKALRKEVKNNKKTFSLTILTDKKSTLQFHELIFGSIQYFADKATDFYTDYFRLWLDFSRIDLSTDVMSIKAYDPIIDQEFKDKFKNKTIQNLNNEEKKRSKLQMSSVNTTLTDSDGINPDDVQQGSLGDCYFLSGVESLARFNPNQIYGTPNSIISDIDDNGHYTVHLYVPDPLPDDPDHLRRVAIKVKPTFVEQKITRDITPPINSGTSRTYSSELHPLFAKQGSGKEMWVQLLEKAVTELEGSYGEIVGTKKDIPLSGLQMLTGQPTTTYSIPQDINAAITALVTAHNNNNQSPMTKFSTRTILPQMGTSNIGSGEKHTMYRPNVKLYANHAYSLVTILNTTANSEVFQLKNPHNHDLEHGVQGGRLIEITRAELSTYFSSIEIS